MTSFLILSPDAYNLYTFAFFGPFGFLILMRVLARFWFF